MARIRFPGSQRPQRTQIAAMRQPQKEKDWYKDPNQLLAWVRLAEALGSKEGLAARGVREIQAQMAESRLEEAGMPQGPVEPSVEQQMAPIVERAMAGDPEAQRMLDPMGARNISESEIARAQREQAAARIQPGYETAGLDPLTDARRLGSRVARMATMPVPPSKGGALPPGMEWQEYNLSTDEPPVPGQVYGPTELQQEEARVAGQIEAEGLWAPLLQRQRTAQAQREVRRGQLEELGVKTVGDVTGVLLDYYQEHSQLPNQVVRDAWMALEDAVENDPTYIREGLTVRDARQEMMQTIRLLREGKEPDELRSLRIDLAKIKLQREQEKDKKKLEKAGRTFKPSTSEDDFKNQFKMEEWQKPTTKRQDQVVEIGDGEALTITYGSDPNGAISQLQYLSSRLRSGSNAQKNIQRVLTRIGTQLTQTERGTAGRDIKEETAEEKAEKAKEEKAEKAKAKEAEKAEKEFEKAVKARSDFFVKEGLVEVDGKLPVMTPTQKAQLDILDAAITKTRKSRPAKKTGRFIVTEK